MQIQLKHDKAITRQVSLKLTRVSVALMAYLAPIQGSRRTGLCENVSNTEPGPIATNLSFKNVVVEESLTTAPVFLQPLVSGLHFLV